MWLAIIECGVFQAIKWWVEAGRPAYVPDATNLTQPMLHLGVVCALGGLLHFTTRNNTEGMRALYGGHRGLSIVVKVAGIMVMLSLGSISLMIR